MAAKKKAMSSEHASYVKRKGHADAREFAEIMGMHDAIFSPTAKKDVADKYGNSFSVKSGEKKWQIFLYGRTRFTENFEFRDRPIGRYFISCIDAFPESREEYLSDKAKYKERLQEPMRALQRLLSERETLEWFLHKSLFNSNEVNYLVIKEQGAFHVFDSVEVVKTIASSITVENSKARQAGQMDDQKVIFKIQHGEKKTLGEIEMRNDSEVHYREVKFWLSKPITFSLLVSKIQEKGALVGGNVKLYGQAKKLLKWYKE